MAKNILLIDDDELVTGSLKLLLKNEGYNVDVAGSGWEAVKKVERADFDLIIFDVRMPGMDGIETVQNIRNYLKGADKNPIPEILITGYADKDKYEEGSALNVSGYLCKPFDNEDLLQAVEDGIGSSKTQFSE